jgi:prepilin-type N-terminal cleavage/methylation domain-containing protein
MRTHVHFGKPNADPNPASRVPRSAGFTLIELMIAMTVFLVIGAAAMSLFKQHAALFNDQQYQIGLNVTLRNALSQMEADVVNAGTGWYNATSSISSWPIGITIVNNVAGGAACHVAGSPTYNAPCFDQLNIIAPDPNTPPGQVWVTPGTPGCGGTQALTTNTTMTIAPVAPVTAAQLIAGFTSGSQVLFIHVGTSGTLMTTAILTANAAAAGANVILTYGATNANGTNNASPINDRLNLTVNPNVDLNLIPTTLTDSFCSGTDWVVKVAQISYSVDTAIDPTGPTLVRTENGVENPIASQIIGFKVGAATVALNGGGTVIGSSAAYCYNSASTTPPCYDNQFDQVRSVRISLIGRTPPKLYSNSNVNSTTLFTNTFDGQPYKIQALSIIVNPRNLSMND